MPDDAELLCRWADSQAEEAFALLVEKHIGLVHAIALRQVGGDAHLALDVTQQVFTSLARKASSLRNRASLTGWLYRSTHFAASDAVRAERRRRAREAEAHLMEQTFTEPARGTADWEKTRPALDAAIAELDERDRDAVALRFFDGCSFVEIGARLRLTENAARMRVGRALDKLHAGLARRGITSTAAALGLALGQQAAAAPAGLAASVAGTAITQAAIGSGGALAWGGALFTMSKIKMGVTALALAGGLAVTVREVHAIRRLEAEIAGAGNVRARIEQLRQGNAELRTAVEQHRGDDPVAAELARLSARLAQLEARPEGVVEAHLRPVAAWRNAGRGSVADAYETLLWAQASEDLEVFASLLAFTPAARTPLVEFFARLPEGVRSKFGTPEKMVAASNPPRTRIEAFQILAQEEHGSKVMLRAWTREKSGRERPHDMVFERHPDGWRPAAFSEKMTDGILASLDPHTGERRAPTR